MQLTQMIDYAVVFAVAQPGTMTLGTHSVVFASFRLTTSGAALQAATAITIVLENAPLICCSIRSPWPECTASQKRPTPCVHVCVFLCECV